VSSRTRKALGAFVAMDVIGTIVARGLGYRVGGNTIVRCRRGHLFTTIWIPGASLKSLRFGWWRFQRCPVGRHWSVVTPVRESSLSEKELRDAQTQRDVRLP
jgi:hypothetical protein